MRAALLERRQTTLDLTKHDLGNITRAVIGGPASPPGSELRVFLAPSNQWSLFDDHCHLRGPIASLVVGMDAFEPVRIEATSADGSPRGFAGLPSRQAEPVGPQREPTTVRQTLTHHNRPFPGVRSDRRA